MKYKRYRVEEMEDGKWLVVKRPSRLEFFLVVSFWRLAIPIIFVSVFLCFFAALFQGKEIDSFWNECMSLIDSYRFVGWQDIGEFKSEDEAIAAIVKDKEKSQKKTVYYL